MNRSDTDHQASSGGKAPAPAGTSTSVKTSATSTLTFAENKNSPASQILLSLANGAPVGSNVTYAKLTSTTGAGEAFSASSPVVVSSGGPQTHAVKKMVLPASASKVILKQTSILSNSSTATSSTGSSNSGSPSILQLSTGGSGSFQFQSFITSKVVSGGSTTTTGVMSTPKASTSITTAVHKMPHTGESSNEEDESDEDDDDVVGGLVNSSVTTSTPSTSAAVGRSTIFHHVPIESTGQGRCSRCGVVGIKDCFYGRNKQYCSQNCLRSVPETNSPGPVFMTSTTSGQFIMKQAGPTSVTTAKRGDLVFAGTTAGTATTTRLALNTTASTAANTSTARNVSGTVAGTIQTINTSGGQLVTKLVTTGGPGGSQPRQQFFIRPQGGGKLTKLVTPGGRITTIGGLGGTQQLINLSALNLTPQQLQKVQLISGSQVLQLASGQQLPTASSSSGVTFSAATVVPGTASPTVTTVNAKQVIATSGGTTATKRSYSKIAISTTPSGPVKEIALMAPTTSGAGNSTMTPTSGPTAPKRVKRTNSSSSGSTPATGKKAAASKGKLQPAILGTSNLNSSSSSSMILSSNTSSSSASSSTAVNTSTPLTAAFVTTSKSGVQTVVSLASIVSSATGVGGVSSASPIIFTTGGNFLTTTSGGTLKAIPANQVVGRNSANSILISQLMGGNKTQQQQLQGGSGSGDGAQQSGQSQTNIIPFNITTAGGAGGSAGGTTMFIQFQNAGPGVGGQTAMVGGKPATLMPVSSPQLQQILKASQGQGGAAGRTNIFKVSMPAMAAATSQANQQQQGANDLITVAATSTASSSSSSATSHLAKLLGSTNHATTVAVASSGNQQQQQQQQQLNSIVTPTGVKSRSRGPMLTLVQATTGQQLQTAIASHQSQQQQARFAVAATSSSTQLLLQPPTLLSAVSAPPPSVPVLPPPPPPPPRLPTPPPPELTKAQEIKALDVSVKTSLANPSTVKNLHSSTPPVWWLIFEKYNPEMCAPLSAFPNFPLSSFWPDYIGANVAFEIRLLPSEHNTCPPAGPNGLVHNYFGTTAGASAINGIPGGSPAVLSTPITPGTAPGTPTKSGNSSGKDKKKNCENQPSAGFFWIVKIVGNSGAYLRLRYVGLEGKPEHDFWINLRLRNLYPIGYARANRHRMRLPKEVEQYGRATYQKEVQQMLANCMNTNLDLHTQFLEHVNVRWMKPGLRVEAQDKAKSACFRPATVDQLTGDRIHIRYDGDPTTSSGSGNENETIGLWTHLQSGQLRPVGWSQLVGHELYASEEYAEKSLERAVELVRHHLKSGNRWAKDWGVLTKAEKFEEWMAWKEGMKLEAVDPFNQLSISVVTIRRVLRFGFLLLSVDNHLDEPKETAVFCAHVSSPYLLPAGFCAMRGVPLQKPIGYIREKFNWPDYLVITQSVMVPIDLFLRYRKNQAEEDRVVNGFSEGMLLEAVDLLEPNLICIAVVKRVVDHLVLLHFIGWEDSLDQWCDCQSTNIFPVGYCDLVGYPLQGPPNKDGGATTPTKMGGRKNGNGSRSKRKSGGSKMEDRRGRVQDQRSVSAMVQQLSSQFTNGNDSATTGGDSEEDSGDSDASRSSLRDRARRNSIEEYNFTGNLTKVMSVPVSAPEVSFYYNGTDDLMEYKTGVRTEGQLLVQLPDGRKIHLGRKPVVEDEDTLEDTATPPTETIMLDAAESGFSAEMRFYNEAVEEEPERALDGHRTSVLTAVQDASTVLSDYKKVHVDANDLRKIPVWTEYQVGQYLMDQGLSEVYQNVVAMKITGKRFLMCTDERRAMKVTFDVYLAKRLAYQAEKLKYKLEQHLKASMNAMMMNSHSRGMLKAHLTLAQLQNASATTSGLR